MPDSEQLMQTLGRISEVSAKLYELVGSIDGYELRVSLVARDSLGLRGLASITTDYGELSIVIDPAAPADSLWIMQSPEEHETEG